MALGSLLPTLAFWAIFVQVAQAHPRPPHSAHSQAFCPLWGILRENVSSRPATPMTPVTLNHKR